MSVLSTTVALVAATPQVLASGDASVVEVHLATALTDLFVGGSAAQTYPVLATDNFSVNLKQGDVLYGLSATGGNVQVLKTRS